MPEISTEAISSSLSVIDKKDIADRHFRWDSILKFIFLANAYSTHIFNFDVFSRSTTFQVLVSEFVFWQIIIGMPYMFMDGFIKQYTRRIDGYKFLNPLLRGISFGLLLQTAFMSLDQCEILSDAVRYLIMTFHTKTPWTNCYGESKNSSCVTVDDIVARYRRKEDTLMNFTAAHYHYVKQFDNPDRTVLTTRYFVMGLVWILNFIISTVADDTLVKIYFFLFVFRTVSTVVIIIVLLLTRERDLQTAFMAVMSTKSETHVTQAFVQVAFAYGVGFLGFYDFNTMSPYTMIDTAVVIYSVFYTLFSIVRSWFIKVLILTLLQLVELEQPVYSHYLFFAVLPLGAEFIYAHRIYAIYLYLNLIITLTGYITMQTLTMSKLLHTEFRSLKIMYIVGLICFIGFITSVPFAVESPRNRKIKVIVKGVSLSVLYLGAFKVAVVMWVYGVERFSTDIQFWLGFRPTKYWKVCWAIMPIILWTMMTYRVYHLTSQKDIYTKIGALAWLIATIICVALFNIKSISRLLLQGNLASIFSPNIRFGPPDRSDRIRRKHYSDTIQLRYCTHNCQVIDERIDCNHMQIQASATGSSGSSIESLKDIYRSEGLGMGHNMSIKHPSMYDLAHHHF